MRDDDRLVPDLPAHDEYLERGVLGVILAQPDREHSAALLNDVAFLEPADFWRETNMGVYLAVEGRRVREGSCLIGDLFRAPGMDSAYLTGLVVEASPAAIVRQEALLLADLGVERLLLTARRVQSPQQLDALTDRVRAKRERIAAARDGVRPMAAYNPLGGD